MRFLFVARQARHAVAFYDAMRGLVAKGHRVSIAVQDAEDAPESWHDPAPGPAPVLVSCPPARFDRHADRAALLRRLRDAVHHLRPAFRAVPALQARFLQKLRSELHLSTDVDGLARALQVIPPREVERLLDVLALGEAGLPPWTAFDEFLRAEKPDVVLVSPLVHAGQSQADVVASARRLGVPTWMLLFSWDNLSTKGCMHVFPDLLFAWNEQQRDEAERLHGFPPDRVVIVGTPRFDAFFDLAATMTRSEFHAPLALRPDARTLLYLCSSPLVAPDELPWVAQWLEAIRRSPLPELREANVVVRPHPANPLLPPGGEFAEHRWPAAPAIRAGIARPLADRAAVVVTTPHEDPRGLYESLAHCDAVVALNTTAELEAGIVNRPVFTIRPDTGPDARHQATVHFEYLTREHGGFVSVAAGLREHVEQLEQALTGGIDPEPIRQFIERFLRPHGLHQPVLPLLIDSLDEHARRLGASGADTTPPAASGPEADGRGAHETVLLRYKRAPIRVHATAEATRHLTDRAVVRLDGEAVEWLDGTLTRGDVLYDIYADYGPYALIAARSGALAIAFEPDFEASAAIGRNFRLNECDPALVALPLSLGKEDALTPRRNSPPGKAVRPRSSAVARLDSLVERHGLPLPTHVRLSRSAAASDIIAGGGRTFSDPSLRTVWVESEAEAEARVHEQLLALGFRPRARNPRRRTVQLVFERSPGPA